LEYGVNPRESAARLLIDQAGIGAESMRLIGVNSTVEGDWILTFAFEASIRGDPAPPRETMEARLVGLDALPTSVHPLARRLLDGYRLTEQARAV
jgi:ADP-ribose pyrophosphatase YjhB (NUDIX family)